jgi:hypothetical protein
MTGWRFTDPFVSDDIALRLQRRCGARENEKATTPLRVVAVNEAG